MLPAFGFILSPGDSVNHVVILDALLTTVPSQSLLCVVEAINGYPDQHNSGWDKSLLLNYLMTTPVIRSPQFDFSEAFCRIIAHTTALHFAFSLSSLLVCVAITFFTPSLRAASFQNSCPIAWREYSYIHEIGCATHILVGRRYPILVIVKVIILHPGRIFLWGGKFILATKSLGCGMSSCTI